MTVLLHSSFCNIYSAQVKGPWTSFTRQMFSKLCLQDGKALVRVKTFSISRVYAINFQNIDALPPKFMGLEVPHFIEQVEKNSKLSLTVGDEVLALSYGGVYADYTTLSTHVLIYNHIIYLGKKLHGFQDLA
ncbi:uncharacterized protein TRIREDRAFT_111833 [Trichoderma reesei QM6a]|uniref:Predicted protein n=2 Tax=Hypocrea jecorina TaxID=51453 RepID=G0RVJ2_HYPJQ|nr:uncharacterized protein TRIREDRAFT_111833 [Trichoderma reesei QM6a]EGR44811.1 predicted protein [Trichoderma reesei QM6a]ETR97661.1 hypothetical protein M419DRAFT_39135 [Trichoderma reesei RUT C-30]